MAEKILRVILGDQLSDAVSSLSDCDKKKDTVLMMEVAGETEYVPHHPKKIAFIFSAMRHFAEELKKKGFNVDYIKLDSKRSKKSFTETLAHFCEKKSFDRLVVTEPGEYRVLMEIKKWPEKLGLEIEILEDRRFLCSVAGFKEWSQGKKRLLMESFYRFMRKETDLLLTQKGKPLGGQWNFDKENREPLKKKMAFPKPKKFKPDKITREVLQLVDKKFSKNFGDLEPFWFAVTRKQAEQAFDHFVQKGLKNFGPFQDAMKEKEHFLFHSVISQYLNCGLLDPYEVCKKVEKACKQKKVPINSAEGFIRQIIGWREYIRGIYWLYMPKYAEQNFLNAKRKLPSYYWDGDTDMNCMKCVIGQTRKEAHSHHIQRLMVTGNFALLAGVDPKEVCEWYLAVYADAYEWVELPNTLGMALFGDGGVLATKPYAASGNYINKMSDFCQNCRYDPKQKTGDDACPFNFLYWNFLIENDKKLRPNPRLKFSYKNLDKMDPKLKKEMKKRAREFL